MIEKYEISLWKDILVEALSGVPTHYEEEKIAILGADIMDAEWRAYEPQLVENINGTNTFTFKMYMNVHNYSVEEVKYYITDNALKYLKDSNTNFLEHSVYEFVDGVYKNPFVGILANESKIKVHWKDKWYDFIIKDCQEDAFGNSITYTCKDAYINELSKTGFELVFDQQNDEYSNQGTALELAQRVIDGTDWQLNVSESSNIRQEKEEPVYETYARNSFSANNDSKGLGTATIPANAEVLLFYSSAPHSDDADEVKPSDIQFLYSADGFVTEVNSQLVINADCYSVSGISWSSYDTNTWSIKKGNTELFRIAKFGGVSSRYRGKSLYRSQKSVFDPVSQKYVDVYRATKNGTGNYSGLISTGDIIYGYTGSIFESPTMVNNLVVNNSNFSSTEGWYGSNLRFTLYPYPTVTTSTSFMCLSGTVYNSGIITSGNFVPNGFQMNEKYVFRIKLRTSSGSPAMPTDTKVTSTSAVTPTIASVNSSTGGYTPGTSYFTISSQTTAPADDGDTWLEYTMRCTKSVSPSSFSSSNIGLFLSVTGTYWMKEAQLFKYVTGESGQRIDPGQYDKSSVSQVNFYYYNHTKMPVTTTAPEQIGMLYIGTEDWNEGYLEKVYNESFKASNSTYTIKQSDVGTYFYKGNTTSSAKVLVQQSHVGKNVSALDPGYSGQWYQLNNFEKIRSITIKNSNRFNILQSIAETFECWVRFEYLRDEASGKIQYVQGVPQKFISLVNEVGQETGVGFTYGIDLQNITRQIQSDQFVTKTMVSPNSNEFATNGFCTISRSKDNYPKTDFILNFDYYIYTDIIDSARLNQDLYTPTRNNGQPVYGNDNSIGYYYWLNKWNTELDRIDLELEARRSEKITQEGYMNMYQDQYSAALQEKQNAANALCNLFGVSSVSQIDETLLTDDNIEGQSYMTRYQNAIHKADTAQSEANALTTAVSNLNAKIEQLKTSTESIKENIKQIHSVFNKKYAQFIQEGSWIDENYMDDDLYYLDGLSIAYRSSRPQISYNISVLRLSGLEEFKNKVFRLGDISYVEDTEFFGYVTVDGLKTPYKEKVLISEITSNFDAPEQDTFKVQNYKTQFEDLFQRITSITQNLQYASGAYNKVASIIDEKGVIKYETLQAAFKLNENLVYSSNNELIYQDNTGITVTDSTNPNKVAKLTSGGLLISNDGGLTWKSAVRGDGLSADYITTGNINTDAITLYNNNYPSFRWDKSGINAYECYYDDESGAPTGTNFKKFVRLDRFGVYGYENAEDTFIPKEENDIWDNARFGLTWGGFFLKNKYNQHTVEISSENDFRIVKQGSSTEQIELIKIGKLEEDDTRYGIRFKNSGNNVTLETDNDGNLWLQNKLSIGSTSGNNIQLGFLDTVAVDDEIIEHITIKQENLDRRYIEGSTGNFNKRTLSINNNFVVWEDGTLYAKDGYFEGNIYAIAGKIGGATIGEVEESVFKAKITVDSSGTVFKNRSSTGAKTLTATLYKGKLPIANENLLSYKWYYMTKDNTGAMKKVYVADGSSKNYRLDISTKSAEEFVWQYGCEITYTEQEAS